MAAWAVGVVMPAAWPDAADIVYRFMPRERLYAGLRYNKAEGTLVGIADQVGADRWQIAGGWFVTRNILSAPMSQIGDLFNNPQLKFLNWFVDQPIGAEALSRFMEAYSRLARGERRQGPARGNVANDSSPCTSREFLDDLGGE